MRELCEREGERLQVPRDSQRSGVDGLKADIANQPRRNLFRIVVVATVEKARPAPSAALRIKDLAFTFLVTVVATVAFGTLPGVMASR